MQAIWSFEASRGPALHARKCADPGPHQRTRRPATQRGCQARVGIAEVSELLNGNDTSLKPSIKETKMKHKLANVLIGLEYYLNRLSIRLGRFRQLHLERPVCERHGVWGEADIVAGFCQRCCDDHLHSELDPSEEQVSELL